MDTKKGYLRLTGSGEGAVSFEGECTVTDEGRQVVIEFDESAAGIEDTKTFLVLSEDVMTLNRVGSYETVMVFERNADNAVTLGSPFGKIVMRLVTEQLDIRKNRFGVDAEVAYRFLLGDTCIENRLSLECKTAGYLEESFS